VVAPQPAERGTLAETPAATPAEAPVPGPAPDPSRPCVPCGRFFLGISSLVFGLPVGPKRRTGAMSFRPCPSAHQVARTTEQFGPLGGHRGCEGAEAVPRRRFSRRTPTRASTIETAAAHSPTHTPLLGTKAIQKTFATIRVHHRSLGPTATGTGLPPNARRTTLTNSERANVATTTLMTNAGIPALVIAGTRLARNKTQPTAGTADAAATTRIRFSSFDRLLAGMVIKDTS
jgi:hypothetical protein